jgi:hypothetical protein
MHWRKVSNYKFLNCFQCSFVHKYHSVPYFCAHSNAASGGDGWEEHRACGRSKKYIQNFGPKAYTEPYIDRSILLR